MKEINFNTTGVFEFQKGCFTAYLNGQRIADFNSKGAADVGIIVEKRRIAAKIQQNEDVQENLD